MDFFESQDRARRNTGRLVVLFCLGVGGTIAAVAGVVAIGFMERPDDMPMAAGVAAVCTGLLVGICGLSKLGSISGPGAGVAMSLGGRPLVADHTSESAQRVRNVVEEMAIASGLPVPPVFVLDDDSINAFAAGRTPEDAAIGLTRGCCQKLTRDELQGVVGHEFSHIFHGDMRLNARTVAAIFGMMVIGIIGWFSLRHIAPNLLRGARGKSAQGAMAAAAIAALFGLALIIIGGIGTFFGRLIQAAVSRQREFLADASAVQYTRNPEGLIGALQKIATEGSAVSSGKANECAHFFFAAALNTAFATHPPIGERIRRLAGANSSAPAPRSIAEPTAEIPRTTPLASPIDTWVPAVAHVYGQAQTDPTVTPASLIPRTRLRAAAASVGNPAAALSAARATLRQVPPDLRCRAEGLVGAQAVVLAVAVVSAPRLADDETAVIARTNAECPDIAAALSPSIASLRSVSTRGRLALLDLCSPTLRALDSEALGRLRALLAAIIGADGRIELGEWTVRMYAKAHLPLNPLVSPLHGSARLRVIPSEAALVLSTLAGLDHEEDVARKAFDEVVTRLGLAGVQFADKAHQKYSALETAIAALSKLRPRDKRDFLDACITCAAADGFCSDAEAQALRAVSDGIGVPFPPLPGDDDGVGSP